MSYQRDFYLIDSENVHTLWPSSLPTLKKRDEVIVFYSKKTKRLPYSVEDLKYISSIGKLTSIECYNGTANALDFELVSWLGARLRTAPKTTYNIVSNDHGYDAVCKFWTKRGVEVKRLGVVSEEAEIKQEKEKEAEKAKSQELNSEAFEVSKISTEAKKVIEGMMRKKYRTDKNYVIAYKALVSGKSEDVNSAIDKIAGPGTNDAKRMKANWMNYVLKIQRLAG